MQNLTALKEIKGTENNSFFPLLIPTPPFIKGKLSLTGYLVSLNCHSEYMLFLCNLFCCKRNTPKEKTLPFYGALHSTMYFYILSWVVF